LDALGVELLEKETLGRDAIAEIFESVKGPRPRGAWTGSLSRKPSLIPPVAIPERLTTEEPDVKEEAKPKRRKKKMQDEDAKEEQ
ncbi:MAG: cell division protein FtsH, partial [Candidatus Nanopelagicaceae bacterium]